MVNCTSPAGAWPNYALGNHDRPRLATRHGSLQARAASMLLLTLRGTPTLYYGDELGMEDAMIPPDRRHDPLGRDGTRTPMQWDASANAGICSPGVEPWLPLAVGDSTVNVAAQLGDGCSLLNLYRRLLAYRKGSTALREGEYRSLDASSPECFAFLREVAGERALVAINFSSLEHVIDLPVEGSGEIVVSTALDRTGPVDLAALALRGDEGVIVQLQPEPHGSRLPRAARDDERTDR